MTSHEWIMEQAEAIKARGATEPRIARDPVNQPAINAWLDAMGDQNPLYRGPDAVAPTAMAQVWTMYALGEERREIEPLHNMMSVLDQAGYTSVLGTNCDQTYERYLRPGEVVSVRAELQSVVGPKQTAMGEGYFVSNKSTWYVGDEEVATMLFRVLKFRPGGGSSRDASEASKRVETTGEAPKAVTPIQPMLNRDTEFFWEGTAAGELRIQSCESCGALRHPPGPMCPVCHETKRAYVVASGRGTVHSFVVHHAPQIPGKTLPLLLALVDLEEGVRMVGEAKDDVEIGDAVEAVFEKSGEVTLVAWRKP